MKKKNKRLYIIKKYVVASSVAEALRRDKKEPVHDIYLEEKSHQKVLEETNEAIHKDKRSMGFF